MKRSLPSPVGRTLGELELALGDAGARLVGKESAREFRIFDVTQDSRNVGRDALFVARRGRAVDGTRFVADAVAGGAVAVLCEPNTVDYEPRLEVVDLERGLALAAHEVYGRPASALQVIGITGTNGKTTVACLVEQALSRLGLRSARLGTLGFFIDGERVAETLTTPQADDVARYLFAARAVGVTHVAMEVSSHALAQGRVLGVEFAVGAFINLSQDHLDYHGTMESYAAAKRKLLDELWPRRRVFNIDDFWGAKWAAELSGRRGAGSDLRVTRGGEHPAEVQVTAFTQSGAGLTLELEVEGRPLRLCSRLLGEHNVENLAVALGCLVAVGIAPEAAAGALAEAAGAPGRLERCDAAEDDITVLVDYAHTPAALSRCLTALANLGGKRITCLFGCGGDRDRGKRPLMGQAAVRLAQRVFITSDNPRTERPEAIVEQIRPGLSGAGPSVEIVFELDRARAIERAIVEAEPGEIVLLAGKGHETYQILGDRVIDFDDRVHARRALQVRRQSRSRGLLGEATF